MDKKQYQNKNQSITSEAFQMLKVGKSRVDVVAIALNLETNAVINLHHEYLRLLNLNRLIKARDYRGNDLPIFFALFDMIRNEGIVSQPAIAWLVHSGGKLTQLKEKCLKVCEQIGN